VLEAQNLILLGQCLGTLKRPP